MGIYGTLENTNFGALLANYVLEAFYSATVHDAFVCRVGTEPPVGQAGWGRLSDLAEVP